MFNHTTRTSTVYKHQTNSREVDLEYPEHLHDAHSAYPLCPEHLTVEASFLSPTLEEMYEFVGGKHEKWIEL